MARRPALHPLPQEEDNVKNLNNIQMLDDNASKAESEANAPGDVLKSLRQKRGESLRDVSDILRISVHYLEAIEEHRFSDLPEVVYTLGFVRSYSKYLNVDDVKYVAWYKSILDPRNRFEALTAPQPSSEAHLPKMWLVIGGVVVMVAVYLLWYAVNDNPSWFQDMTRSMGRFFGG